MKFIWRCVSYPISSIYPHNIPADLTERYIIFKPCSFLSFNFQDLLGIYELYNSWRWRQGEKGELSWVSWSLHKNRERKDCLKISNKSLILRGRKLDFLTSPFIPDCLYLLSFHHLIIFQYIHIVVNSPREYSTYK